MYAPNNPNLFQAFLEHTSAAVAMLDNQMCYLCVSQQWLEDYQLTGENLKGRSLLDSQSKGKIAPALFVVWEEAFRACLHGHKTHSEGNYIITSGNGKEWLQWDMTPWRDQNGEIAGAILSSHFFTTWKQQEEILRQTEARFLKLSANLPGMIFQFLLQPDGGVLYPFVSSGCRDLFELEPDDVEGNPFLIIDRIHPDDRRSHDESIAVSARLLTPFYWEGRFITPNGEIKWVEASSRPEKQADDSVLWDGLVIDVTSRKIAEIALQQYQEKLTEIVQKRTGELTQANLKLQAEIADREQHLAELHQAEVALRESEAKLRAQAQREKLLNQLANQIRDSLDLEQILETAVFQIRHILKVDYCYFSWEREELETTVTLSPLFSHQNYPHRHLTCPPTSSDNILRVDDVESINDRALKEFMLQQGYTALLSLPIQTDSGRRGAITCGHCDVPREWTDEEVELMESACSQLAIAIRQAELYQQANDSANQAQKQATELETALQKLQSTQAQLIQTEKMSSLGQLVAGVAHEINNPVNFIYGNLAHLESYTHQFIELINLYAHHLPSDQEIQEMIKEIDLEFLISDIPKLFCSMKIGTERIREIVLSLRNFSRLDEAQMKAVDIHEGIDSTLMILQHRLKQSTNYAEIKVIKNYGNLPQIECYAGQLNQVFMNLLANAIDALENVQKKIEKFEPRLEIFTDNLNQNEVIITIKDNGEGMVEEIKQKIFDPFFTTKPIGVGTGLGLAISYQVIVEKHQGKIEVESRKGEGTKFILILPIKAPFFES